MTFHRYVAAVLFWVSIVCIIVLGFGPLHEVPTTLFLGSIAASLLGRSGRE